MADDVFDKADSLMRRHRAFVAPGPADTMPAVPHAGTDGALAAPNFSAPAEHEDIPVLTEVISSHDDAVVTLPTAADIEAMLRERIAAALPQQRELLRRELALWLDEQLPQLVMRVLDGVTDQLVSQINTQARMTLLPKLHAVLEAEATLPNSPPASPPD